MTDISESQKWDSAMGALEANWLAKMTECQDEYKNEYMSFYGIPPANMECEQEPD